MKAKIIKSVTETIKSWFTNEVMCFSTAAALLATPSLSKYLVLLLTTGDCRAAGQENRP